MPANADQREAGRIERAELAPGYSVPRILQGCWQLSAGHGLHVFDQETLIERLVERVRQGFDTFDCADIYTGVEELLGGLRKRAHQKLGAEAHIQVHTKLVPDLSTLDSVDRSAIERVIDRSLDRLGVERLDLVQFHWWRYDVERFVEVATWLGEIAKAGKIRHLGLTNFDVQRTQEILDAGAPVVSLQVQYSLLDRRPRGALAELCKRHDLHLLCYGSLAGGFLSERWLGQPEPNELANRSLQKYRLIIDEVGGWQGFQNLLETLDSLAKARITTIPAIATRWVLEQPSVDAVIVGVGDGSHDLTRMAALRLGAEDHERLDRALDELPSPPGGVYELEREIEGRHGRIMKYDLSRV